MSSPVRRELEGYLAGHVKAERVVIAAAVAYYRDEGSGMRPALRPVIDVIDRASPGIVELGSTSGGSGTGFEVRLAERPFPERYEAELRQAAQLALSELAVGSPRRGGEVRAVGSAPGLFRRVLNAIQRIFNA